MSKKYKRFSPEEKVLILRRHLVDKTKVSDLCDQNLMSPAEFYRWQKAFFENGAAALQTKGNAKTRKLEAQIDAQKTKLAQKDEVIAEIMQSHIALKKTLGQN